MKKSIIFFLASFFFGIILNFTNFNLSGVQMFGVISWISSLITGSFIGAYLFSKSKQESLLAFSMPFSFLLCGWIAWIFLHLFSYSLFPFLLIGLGLWSLAKLERRIIIKVLSYNSYFLIIFWLFLVLNSFHPEIYWGEKPMDYNLLNFMGRNTEFPPMDPWFSGSTMKYYYFGYFLFGKLAPFLKINSEVMFHLSIATSAGFFFLAGMSLMKSFGHNFITSVKGASFLLFSTSIGAWVGYIFEGKRGVNSFWASTRIFENNGFAEFPLWSFLFGDLHPHVMNYPYALFVLTLLVRIVKGEKRKFFSVSTFILGFSWAALGAINSWDVIYCNIIFILLVLFTRTRIWQERSVFLALIIGGICWSPMMLSLLGGNATKIGIYAGDHNSILNYIYHHAIVWSLSIIYLIFYKIDKIKISTLSKSLIVCFFCILLASEYFFFMDRMNTIFKFGNQLFILGGVICLSLYKNEKKFNFTLYGFFIVLLISTIQLELGVNKYNAFGTARPTLQGALYMNKVNAGDYLLIQHIQNEIKGTPVIIESYGKSFDNNRARISMHTGLPSYLGWEGHAIIRGANPRKTLIRKKEIDALYNSLDAVQSYEWLNKRGIKYVVVGGAEHSQYNISGLNKFKTYIDLFKPMIQTNYGNRVYGLYKVGK